MSKISSVWASVMSLPLSPLDNIKKRKSPVIEKKSKTSQRKKK